MLYISISHNESPFFLDDSFTPDRGNIKFSLFILSFISVAHDFQIQMHKSHSLALIPIRSPSERFFDFRICNDINFYLLYKSC